MRNISKILFVLFFIIAALISLFFVNSRAFAARKFPSGPEISKGAVCSPSIASIGDNCTAGTECQFDSGLGSAMDSGGWRCLPTGYEEEVHPPPGSGGCDLTKTNECPWGTTCASDPDNVGKTYCQINPLSIDSECDPNNQVPGSGMMCPEGSRCIGVHEDDKFSYVCRTTDAPTPTPPNAPPPCTQWADLSGTTMSADDAKNRDDVKCISIDTAIGPIPTDPAEFVKRIYSFVLGIAGGIALIMVILSGYKFMASQGNPEAIKSATEGLTSAVIGLLFIIFAFVILQIVGVDILRIPGFNP